MLNIDFRYLEFCTKYSSEGTTNKRMYKEYCFGRIFDGEEYQKNKYCLYIYNTGYEKNWDNNCLLTKEQLILFLNDINKIFKFTYTLKKNVDGYTLKFEIDAPIIYHKIILSWIRYTYEFPYNITLYEVFKVKEEKGFKRITIFNLFNLIGSTMHCTKHGTSIHAIGNFYDWKKLINYKDFKKIIEARRKHRPHIGICSLIEVLDENKFEILKLGLNYRLNHTDYWENEKEYKKRLKLYRSNLKILKKLSK